MAYEILSESYGARLPKITATADSTDDLATMGTNYAEGSTCVIGDKTYALDKVQGWVEPGSGGGGGGGLIVNVTEDTSVYTMDKTAMEIVAAVKAGSPVYAIFPDTDELKDDIASIVAVRGEVEDGEVYRYSVYVYWRGQSEQYTASEANNWYPSVSYD